MPKRFIEKRLTALFGAIRPTRWITRERPKIDRIACPWLIRRFIDPEAVVLYAPTPEVFRIARQSAAVPFDMPGAEPFTHAGEECSFDAFIRHFRLDDRGLHALAPIVRGADTDRHDLAPQASGLHAVSLGLSALYAADAPLLEQGLVLYDALYAWATKVQDERHGWRPQALVT